jgi:hypothetical protein
MFSLPPPNASDIDPVLSLDVLLCSKMTGA